jgi:hypothetical protein
VIACGIGRTTDSCNEAPRTGQVQDCVDDDRRGDPIDIPGRITIAGKFAPRRQHGSYELFRLAMQEQISRSYKKCFPDEKTDPIGSLEAMVNERTNIHAMV